MTSASTSISSAEGSSPGAIDSQLAAGMQRKAALRFACQVALLVVAPFFGWLIICSRPCIVDETDHCEQIHILMQGRLEMQRSMAAVPGYHAVMAVIATPMQLTGHNSLRLLSLCFSMLAILFFALAAQSLDARSLADRVLQFEFFPILFPFLFLVYTDVMSLLFVLLGTFATLKRAYAIGALGGVLSMLVRQNNIIWFAFLLLLFVAQEYGDLLAKYWQRIRHRRITAILPERRTSALAAVGIGTVYTLGFLGFLAFVTWNGGIAMGDRKHHPFPAIHAGNVVFLLMILASLLFPLHRDNMPRIVALVRREWKWILPLFVVLFAVYMLIYVNDHPYNQGMFCVRNILVLGSTYHPLLKALFFVPVAWTLLSLFVTRLKRPVFYALYPLTIAYLSPSWLIEPRYLLVPCALFLLFREDLPDQVERLSARWSIAASMMFFFPISMGWFFF